MIEPYAPTGVAGEIGAPARSALRVRRVWRRVVAPLVLALVWELSTRLRLVDPLFLPPLSSVFADFAELVGTGEFFEHLFPSLNRALQGYVIAVVFGIPIGFLFGWSRIVREYMGSVIEIMRPVPPISLIPLAILWLGIGDLSKIGIIAWACFWPIFLNSTLGVQSINPIFIKSARNMEIHGVRFFSKILLPAALPQVFAGLRISLAIAFIVLVAAEMVGADRGLGYLILESERMFRSPRMFVGIFSIAMIGFLLNEIILLFERRLFAYREEIN